MAGAREYLDLVIDEADGNLQIISGNQEYGMGANWKLLVKSSIDGYHAASTHDTYFKYLVFTGYRLERGVSCVTRDLGNGRAVLEHLAPWGPPDRQVGTAVRAGRQGDRDAPQTAGRRTWSRMGQANV